MMISVKQAFKEYGPALIMAFCQEVELLPEALRDLVNIVLTYHFATDRAGMNSTMEA